MSDFNLYRANKQELLDHARGVLNLEVDDNTTVVDLREMIKTIAGDADSASAPQTTDETAPQADTAGLAEAPSAQAAAAQSAPAPQPRDSVSVPGVQLDDPNHRSNSGKWAVIVISPDDKDKRDAQVAVNGKQYLIQRGKEVAVPPCVFEALKNAVQTVYPDRETMEPVYRQTYPFSVVKQGAA